MVWLPHRYSERSVQRFLPMIRPLLSAWPNLTTVTFDPAQLGLSMETALARLRDAITSLSSRHTTDPTIDSEALSQLWPHYKVTSDGSRVVVCPRSSEKETPPPTVAVGDVSQPDTGLLATLVTNEPRFVETLTAFALLLGQRRLSGQVEIVGDLPLELQNELMQNNDIAITKQPNGNHIML